MIMIRGLVFLSLASCAASPTQTALQPVRHNLQLNVHVRNDLEECVHLASRSVSIERNVVLLDVSLRMRRSIGECGCKSAALTYRVRRDEREHGTVDAIGRLNTLLRQHHPEEDLYLVLSTDVLAMAQAKNATVEVTCTSPE